jgi:hypothetical protein
LPGFIIGLTIALTVIKIEQHIRQLSLKIIIGGVAGMIVGLLIALIISFGLNFVSKIRENQQAFLDLSADYRNIQLSGPHLGRKKSKNSALRIDSKTAHDHRILDTVSS